MKIVKTVYHDQTLPSPVCTFFVDVPFQRTLKTPFYMYLLFVVTVCLSYLLLNICIGFLKTELKYRELNPLALKRMCCNIAGFVPTMNLDETSVEVIQKYAS